MDGTGDVVGRLMRENDDLQAEVWRLRERLDRMAIENVGLAAEVAQLRATEGRVQRLLAECDRNEAHIRAHVPHLPPEGGSFSVHVIRRFLRDDPSTPDRTTDGGT